MSDLEWGILIGAVVLAATLYAWRSFNRESDVFTELLERIRFKYHGELTPKTALAYPQLTFTHDGCKFQVGAMATDGTPGGSSFTFIEVRLPEERELPEPQVPSHIKARVTEGRLHLHRDGIASTREELDELIDAAFEFAVKENSK